MKKLFLYASAVVIGVLVVGGGILFVWKPANTVEYAESIHNSVPIIRRTHPRILLPELSSWDGNSLSQFIQSRLNSYQTKGLKAYRSCGNNDIMAKTACWVTTGNSAVAEQLISAIKNFTIEPPEVVGEYGNAWELAFAYDFLTLYPGFTLADRLLVEDKLSNALNEYLDVLADDSPSLWHGRTTLASRAWLCAVVLDLNATQTQVQDSIKAAHDYFLESFAAVSLTEAWPEGYNYWIQERAFELILATSAYINSIEDTKYRTKMLNVIKRIGLWHIYATRPDNRIEGFGDEGSRIDLKDQTRRIIDLIGQLTKDPVFSLYSRYIQTLHGRASYYQDFKWGFTLFNDPNVDLFGENITTLEPFNVLLPRSELFGKGAFNQVFIRSGWDQDATFISFRAGDTFTHHGHYDAGHFTLFKKAPLAINSSVYGNIFSENRLNYSIRTIAKNSLLILRPGEKVHPNRFFGNNVADGGQRVVMPTGSAIFSVDDWMQNLNARNHYEGGRLLHFQNSDADFVYINSDLTDAYNTPRYDEGGSRGKVSLVLRQLLYLTQEDVLVVHDSITATDASYVKKWLLHTANRPKIDGLQVLKGSIDNGILESGVGKALIKNNDSYLSLQRFHPADARLRLVGGSDYQYYVEYDGDDSDLDGKNFTKGAVNKPWFDVGRWRIEIQPAIARKKDHFLVVLSPSLLEPREQVVNSLQSAGNGRGLLSKNFVVLFVDTISAGKLTFKSPSDKTQLLVFGLPEKSDVIVSNGENEITLRSNSNGIVKYKWRAGFAGKNSVLTLRW
ncbi:MAG: hypothetical protein GXP08_07310 [Gammaproteobacteria bacterium]|nr:hypothetical protein [Gammaproteobacteria bacterium]